MDERRTEIDGAKRFQFALDIVWFIKLFFVCLRRLALFSQTAKIT
jgi:hypothetical protein